MLSTVAGTSPSAPVAGTTSTTSTISSPTKKEDKKLRIVVAVGGNALQRRGDRLTIENQLKAAAAMAPTMVELAKKHELVCKNFMMFPTDSFRCTLLTFF
jgi:hypothetical protein